MVDSAVILRRVSGVRQNLVRLEEKSNVARETLDDSLDVQDVVLHNLQHAIQGCIDMGTHVLADEGWGTPGSQNEIFRMLRRNGVIDGDLTEEMARMVGLRNVLVHEYDRVDMDVVHNALQQDLPHIESFLLAVVRHFGLGT